MKIIVVDDEIAALNTFLPNVTDSGYECKLFKSQPLKALEYVKKEKTDVAVLDVKMPDVNGIELAESMIKADKSIKIIIITAYVQDTEDVKRRLGNNLAGFLYKPYDSEKLKELLRSVAPAPEIFIKTFDAFDLFINGAAVQFYSAKAKELLALLTDADGSYVDINTAIDCLWPDKDSEHGKRLYRDAVCRLRIVLRENRAEALVTFERGKAVINRAAANCDLWTLLKDGGYFTGKYMPQYAWSLTTESKLNALFGKN